MTRILIDLTDLEKWSGHHGGTQRVVYNIARNFYLSQQSLEQEVVFVSFDEEIKRFRKISFEPILKKVENVTTDTFISYSSPTTPSLLRVHFRRVLPRSVRQFLRDKVLQMSHPKQEWVEFTSQDMMLILGKPWDNPDIQITLSRERAQIGFKLAQVVYDLIICLYPHLQNPVLIKPYTDNMIEAIKNSDLLLPISRSTRTDLAKFARLKQLKLPNTKVIRLGDEMGTEHNTTKIQKPSSQIKANFIACIGTMEIRKNHTLLYYTYKLAAQRNLILPQLVIVGGQGWLAAETQYLINNDPSIKNKIIILHDINDAGLEWIYQNCLFTIYPSMYEGWGLPVAEALARGKLSLASNVSSMPEIAKELIDYFSPYNPQECLEKILYYKHRKHLLSKEREIRKKYKPVSWEATYQQLQSYLAELGSTIQA